MATETTYPGLTQIDPQIGGQACTNLGTGSPGGSCDCDGASACFCCASCPVSIKSVRYSGWDNPVNDADYSSIALKFNWAVSGGNSVPFDCTSNTKVFVEYSRNVGSTWFSASGFPKIVSGSASGTSSTTISDPAPWAHTQFRVRVYAIAECESSVCSSGGCSPPCEGADCNVSIDVDQLRLEGTYSIGACCQACGNCVGGQSQTSCTGTFQGDGTECSPNPCSQPVGACCNGGSCTQTLQSSCVGTWLGCGTNCSPNPCSDPTGSCCDGTDCNVTTQAACTGSWVQSGSCTPNPCVSTSGIGRAFSFGI